MGASTTRIVLPLDTGWQFLYESIDGPVQPTGEWVEVRLPHDYSIEHLPGRDSPFDPAAPGSTSTGYTLGGVGVYRKSLFAEPSWKGRTVRLCFDGVYHDARVSLNGKELCHHPYGYSPFFVDLTEHLEFGASNELVVRTDTSGRHTRWYSGGGIYRPVRLLVTGPTAFAPWGALVDTPSLRTLRVRWTIEGLAEDLNLRLRLLGHDGSTAPIVVDAPVREARGEVMLNAPEVRAWSPDSPSLYRLSIILEQGGVPIDDLTIPIGFRTVEVHPDFGLLLNGSPIKVRGACVHHDNGCLGAKAFPAAEEWRVRQLKRLGFNAVRTAHNPPSTAFLDACDRLGLLVLDEAFDQWSKPKNPQDYHRFFPQHGEADLRAMVLRDYNHPSVVAWSIGNEIPERADPAGVAIAQSLVRTIREIDPLRPVSAGVHSFWDQPGRQWSETDPAFRHLDIAGYNYQWREYEPDRGRVPDRVIWGTESFPQDALDSWIPALKHAWVVGDFVWTGMDYLGEAGIGHFRHPDEPDDWIDRSVAYTVAGCGDIDLTGEIRPQGMFRQIVWGTGPGLCILVDSVPEGRQGYTVSGWGWPDEQPSWTWPGTEGQARKVRVFCRHPQVRLFLNGRDLGTQPAGIRARFVAEFSVPYEPGVLLALGLDASGNVLESASLQTAGKPVALRLCADRQRLTSDAQDLAFVEVEVVDEAGRRCPSASLELGFSVEGPFMLEAVCNGDIRSTESFRKSRRRAWRGRCLAVIRSLDQPGEGRLTVCAEGLRPSSCPFASESEG